MYRKIVLAAATVVTMVIPAAALAQVEESSPDKALRERIELVCARVPEVEERVQAVIDRVNGDAETVGSNAWLEAAAASAEEAGRDSLADGLRSRIGIRTERLDVLEARLVRLAEISARCETALS